MNPKTLFSLSLITVQNLVCLRSLENQKLWVLPLHRCFMMPDFVALVQMV